MLLKASFIAAAAVLPSVFGAAIATRDQIDPNSCTVNGKYLGTYNGQLDQSCANLVKNCLHTLDSIDSADLWSVPTCVVGLTCDDNNLLILAQCQNPEVSVTGAPHLNYDVSEFLKLLSLTMDFFYGHLNAIGSNYFPSSVDSMKAKWWTPIVDWTATGETIPYMNFDDWLHYAFTGTD